MTERKLRFVSKGLVIQFWPERLFLLSQAQTRLVWSQQWPVPTAVDYLLCKHHSDGKKQQPSVARSCLAAGGSIFVSAHSPIYRGII